MEIKQQEIHQAISDLALIRRAIAGGGSETGSPPRPLLWLIHLGLLGLSGVLLLIEFSDSYSLTQSFLYSASDRQYRLLGIANLAFILILLVGGFYFALWHAASREEEGLDEYVRRNFSYLKGLSFLSDLFVKFAAIALVILALRPEWVAPLLLLFTGDYLIKGVFFAFPVRIGILLGLLCFGAALLQFNAGVGDVSYPLMVFFGTTVLSMLSLRGSSAQDKGR